MGLQKKQEGVGRGRVIKTPIEWRVEGSTIYKEGRGRVRCRLVNAQQRSLDAPESLGTAAAG